MGGPGPPGVHVRRDGQRLPQAQRHEGLHRVAAVRPALLVRPAGHLRVAPLVGGRSSRATPRRATPRRWTR